MACLLTFNGHLRRNCKSLETCNSGCVTARRFLELSRTVRMSNPAEHPAHKPQLAPQRAKHLTASKAAFLALVFAASISTGYFIWVDPNPDKLSEEDRAVLLKVAATTPIAARTVPLDTEQEIQKAIEALDLPKAEANKVLADAKAGKIHLTWITLTDFIDEDGDIVEVAAGGLTRSIPITNVPQTIVVPVIPGDFLRVTGTLDGHGGGVTVSAATAGAEILMPLNVGQTIALPVR
jgi:hypothetical protein